MGLSCSKHGDSVVDAASAVEDKQDAMQSSDPEMYEFWKKSVRLFDASSTDTTGPGQFHLLYSKKQQPAQGSVAAASICTPASISAYSSQSVAAVKVTPSNSAGSTIPPGPRTRPERANHPVKATSSSSTSSSTTTTRLLIRRHAVRRHEEGVAGTHIYACRMLHDHEDSDNTAANESQKHPEQRPPPSESAPPPTNISTLSTSHSSTGSGAMVIHVDQLFSPAAMAKPPTRKSTYSFSCFLFLVTVTVSEC